MSTHIQTLLTNFTLNKSNKGHASRSSMDLEEYTFIVNNNFLIRHFSQIDFNVYGRVLEVGSSIGSTTFALARNPTIEAVVGIEPEKEAFELSVSLKELFDQANKVEFINAPLGPKVKQQFDFIICNTVIEHTSNPQECLSTMMSLIKPGGSIYISAPNYSIPYEPHIRLFYFVPFLGKKWIKLLAKLTKRNHHFVDHLSLVTFKEVSSWVDKKKFDFTNVFWQKVAKKDSLVYSQVLRKILSIPLISTLLLKIVSLFSIYPSIEVIIKKKV